MRFENKPQLILTKDEFETLDKALKLCRDMNLELSECDMCPFQCECSHFCEKCTFDDVQDMLKKIIDIAIVK